MVRMHISVGCCSTAARSRDSGDGSELLMMHLLHIPEKLCPFRLPCASWKLEWRSDQWREASETRSRRQGRKRRVEKRAKKKKGWDGLWKRMRRRAHVTINLAVY